MTVCHVPTIPQDNLNTHKTLHVAIILKEMAMGQSVSHSNKIMGEKERTKEKKLEKRKESKKTRKSKKNRGKASVPLNLPQVGIPNVTLSIMAETNDNGKYEKAGMQALPIIKTPIEDRIADILEVAPFVMFKLVRAKAAVHGKPPARPVRAHKGKQSGRHMCHANT